jgi:hypothetical protein
MVGCLFPNDCLKAVENSFNDPQLFCESKKTQLIIIIIIIMCQGSVTLAHRKIWNLLVKLLHVAHAAMNEEHDHILALILQYVCVFFIFFWIRWLMRLTQKIGNEKKSDERARVDEKHGVLCWSLSLTLAAVLLRDVGEVETADELLVTVVERGACCPAYRRVRTPSVRGAR